jgi:hypothetical protein
MLDIKFISNYLKKEEQRNSFEIYKLCKMPKPLIREQEKYLQLLEQNICIAVEM